MNFISQFNELIGDFTDYIEQEIYFDPEIFKAYVESSKEVRQSDNNFFMGICSPTPDLLVVSDRPFWDSTGTVRAFETQAGELFTRMLLAMKLKKEQVFITNFYKANEENLVHDYVSILSDQISTLNPRIILILGSEVVCKIFNLKKDFEGFRQENDLNYQGIRTIVSYHPEDLLKNNNLKKAAWGDLQKVMGELGI